MPLLVHLADERKAAAIKKNGIKTGRYNSGVFCMPVLPAFYVSHQWLRELRRFGVNTFVGVYFKIDSTEKVFAGRFDKPHRHISLGEAIAEILMLEDPLGYELIIDRKIEAGEIHDIRQLPQNIGWRYMPNAHGKPPCGCIYCQRGLMKGKKIREKFGNEPTPERLAYGEIITRLQEEKEDEKLLTLIHQLSLKKRRCDPFDLLFLPEKNNPVIDAGLARALPAFRHKNTKVMLQMLLEKDALQTRQRAAESLLQLFPVEYESLFQALEDAAIVKAMANRQEKSAG